jgi:mannosyl-glycoprotein endo-beta-N-acetylglucosaminidase
LYRKKENILYKKKTPITQKMSGAVASKKHRLNGLQRFVLQVFILIFLLLLPAVCTLRATGDFAESQLTERVATFESYNFIREIAPIAKSTQKETGLLPSVTLAQACLESDFGRSLLASKHHNLFGIKAYGNEPQVTMSTQEYVDKKWITIKATFRTYNSWAASVADHTKLFVDGVSWDSAHYHAVLAAKTPEAAVAALEAAGYATDPNYAAQLLALINEYQLTTYDS